MRKPGSGPEGPGGPEPPPWPGLIERNISCLGSKEPLLILCLGEQPSLGHRRTKGELVTGTPLTGRWDWLRETEFSAMTPPPYRHGHPMYNGLGGLGGPLLPPTQGIWEALDYGILSSGLGSAGAHCLRRHTWGCPCRISSLTSFAVAVPRVSPHGLPAIPPCAAAPSPALT